MTANKKQVASSSTKTKKKKKLRQCMEENKEHLSTFAHVKAGSQSGFLTALDRDEAGPVYGWRRRHRRRQMSGVCCSRREKAFLPQSLSISLPYIYIMQDKFPFSPGRKVLPWLLVLLLFSWTRPKYASLAAFAAGQETLVACVEPAAIFSLEML